MTEWGVHNYGSNLIIDYTPSGINPSKPVVIDVETDEKDNFVGLGYTQDGITIRYTNQLSTLIDIFTVKLSVIGHNLKFDCKLLNQWGTKLSPDQLFADTILMSYVINATKPSHSLKELGKELGYEWPTYKEIVGQGRGKVTLDKQPAELVARYCGMDVMVTYKLYEHFNKKMDNFQRRVYSQIEMPLMRILYEMELKGVLIDVQKLRSLDGMFGNRLEALKRDLQGIVGKEINPNSNKQVAEALTGFGFELPRTPKGNLKVDKHVLEQHKSNQFVSTLIEHNKIEKLWSTYTQGMLKRDTDTIKCTYNQITKELGSESERGISTGRLSSSDPNLQQIPTRTEEGKLLRELFVPKPGNILIDADYSQIEYRLLAHFTKEPVLVEAFKNGEDVHEATGRALGCDRDTGKTLNFASIYGAQAKKIAKTAKVTEEKAEEFLKAYWSKLPNVTAWVNRVKHQAKQQGGVYTFMKRWIPLPDLRDPDMWMRFAAERKAVNYVIQGSAAEVMKMAMIELRKSGFLPLLTVHDELLFEYDPEIGINEDLSLTIKSIMEDVVKLDVPLVANVGVGKNWREAKGD